MKKKDLTNKKFGMLTVLYRSNKFTKSKSIMWTCLCDCGNIKDVLSPKLIFGGTKSCGCLRHKSRKKEKENLVGKIYEKLIVINIIRKAKHDYYWNCKCVCGKYICVSGTNLKKNKKTSCGCDKIKLKKIIYNKRINLVGDIFSRLTVIERASDVLYSNKYIKTRWRCLCICGKYCVVTTTALKSKNTQSCGCFQIESKKNNAKTMIRHIKYSKQMFSAKCVWWGTYKEYDGISFEEFYKMSQDRCFYCNIEPNRKFNHFKSNNDGLFIYNGLDRIDSALSHKKENLVTCCYTCNMSKTNSKLDTFINYIRLLKNNKENNKSEIFIVNDLSKHSSSYNVSVKCAFSKYSDEDLSLNDFYFLSQQKCHYCGYHQYNSYSKYKSKNKEDLFKYNGLDRIDSNIGHFKHNVVACCFRCNFAKSNLKYNVFIEWIDRVVLNYENLIKKINNCKDINYVYNE